MKTILASASTAILAFFGKFFVFAEVHPYLANTSAVIGLLSGIGALVMMVFTVRKSIAETDKVKNDDAHEAAKFRAWLKDQCRKCEGKDECAFPDPDRLPPGCKWKQKTDVDPKKKGANR